MKFLFYAPQMAAYGGMERHICSLAVAAARAGHPVRLLTTSNSLGPELRRELSEADVDLRELPCARGSAGPVRKINWLLRQVWAARWQDWQVIYTNGQSALSRLVWHAGGRRTRIVHHHHTAADAAEQRTWSRAFRAVLKRAPRLVGCSRATCDALNAAVGRTDAQFLPYLTNSPVAPNQIVERAPGRPVRFGYCGRLIPEKGIDIILALANDPQLADIEWHLHGAGDAYPATHFEGRPRVMYHGAYRSADEQARALLGLDALALFSSHNEGMPLALIEGMSAGLPWIATDRGGVRELAAPAGDYVLAPAAAGSVEMADSVRALADSILAGKTSRRRQRAIYDERFAPPLVAARWLDFFNT